MDYGFFIREQAIKNLLSAQRKMAAKGNAKGLIAVTKFILSISHQFDGEMLKISQGINIDGSVTSEAGSEAGDTKLTVKEQLLSPRNCWKYKDAAAATSVTYGMDVKNWSKWDGESEIASTAGHHITLVECDQNYKAVRSGDVAVTVNPGA